MNVNKLVAGLRAMSFSGYNRPKVFLELRGFVPAASQSEFPR
jgi:hypothetical protein